MTVACGGHQKGATARPVGSLNTLAISVIAESYNLVPTAAAGISDPSGENAPTEIITAPPPCADRRAPFGIQTSPSRLPSKSRRSDGVSKSPQWFSTTEASGKTIRQE